MSASNRLSLWVSVAATLLAACGDSGGSPDGFIPDPLDATTDDGGMPEAGLDAGGTGGSGGRGPRPDSGGTGGSGGSGGMDAGMDAAAVDTGILTPQLPEDWTCPADFFTDSICDCGCGAFDLGCGFAGCATPGECPFAGCEACFAADGTWQECAIVTSTLICNVGDLADGLCDCGCGEADPACLGRGCAEYACRRGDCDKRHGCTGITDPGDDSCSTTNPTVLTNGTWKCEWDAYGGGNGCDCGCGAVDPDCVIDGCSPGGCHDVDCQVCHDADARPIPCGIAQVGWTCDPRRYDADDGCDCGCGAADPDCSSPGCTAPGCADTDCDRCTNISGDPTGCAPTAWTDEACDPDNYGTGDGCDCGCGVADPDCAALGVAGCTTNGCTATGCDVCHDGAGFYVECDDWTCTDVSATAFGNAQCDCGCGVIDPYCRDVGRKSCTDAGCEASVCDYCNDLNGAIRVACGGEWESNLEGSACDIAWYGLDGLCDCGCGAIDPDCDVGEGCTERGCHALGCELCHDGQLDVLCSTWHCDPALRGANDGCDCGCGAPDPDCGNDGCSEPGCGSFASEVTQCARCFDPNGREVVCP